jgi:hypothetical protein
MEIRDARALRQRLRTSPPGHGIAGSTWEWWAPGDCTRYRVFLTYAPHVDGNFFITLLTFQVGDDFITLTRRRQLWTPQLFLKVFGERYAGWWAGVRPVLAAFNWTDVRPNDFTYNSADVDVIGQLL